MTKDKVFWSAKSESHAEIIEEHKLHADGASGPNIAKVEVNPPNGDFSLPLDEWLFKLDEDVQPKWYDPAAIEVMVRDELVDWVAAKIVLPGETREVADGHIVVCYGTITALYGSSVVQRMCGSSVVQRMCDSSVVQEMCDSSVVQEMYDSSVVQEMYGSSVVQRMCGSSVVTAAYTTLPRSILQSPQAVLIDRSGPKIKCYVGKTPKGKS